MSFRLTPLSLSAVALALAMSVAAVAAPARADEPQRRTLSVAGSGEASARPDIAYIETGVVTEAKTAAEALAANTKAMNAVFKGLEAMKIARDDIQTSEFSVNPVYNNPPIRPDGTHEAPTIRGYQVANQVSVTIRNLDSTGAVLDKLVNLGSNRLNGIRFAIEKPEPLFDKARADAVRDAMRKAKLYAEAAGLQLGQVVSLSESGSYSPQPVYAKAMMAEMASVPVAAGTQKLAANVSLIIEIK